VIKYQRLVGEKLMVLTSTTGCDSIWLAEIQEPYA